MSVSALAARTQSPQPKSFALERLLRMLEAEGYDFVPPTPATHARVVARPDRVLAHDLQGIFGWSLPFPPALFGSDLLELLREEGIVIAASNGLLRSRVRVARLHGHLFVHSAYPTTAQDSVFLGPDSYRFANFIADNMPKLPPFARIVDYGTGAGVGGIVAASNAMQAQLLLADINPAALELASINASHAGLQHQTTNVRAPTDLEDGFDLFTTHPPFMIDHDHRAYRDGGGMYGAELSCDWVRRGAAKLARGGTLIMHTGAPIVGGRDILCDTLHDVLDPGEFSLDYRELDPDIFGDELDKPAYSDVERIAAVGAVVKRKG